MGQTRGPRVPRETMTTKDATTTIRVTGGEIMGVRIGLDPNRPGPDRVRLLDYSIPIWAVIGHLQAVEGDIAQAAAGYAIPVEAVLAAKAYYEAYPHHIDTRLAINRAATE
jgi:hypothetical protein